MYVCEWIDECMHVICECIDEWIVSDRVMSISMVQMMMMLMIMIEMMMMMMLMMMLMMLMIMIEMMIEMLMMMMLMMMSMYKRSPLNILANSWHCGTSAIDEMNPVDIISTNKYHRWIDASSS